MRVTSIDGEEIMGFAMYGAVICHMKSLPKMHPWNDCISSICTSSKHLLGSFINNGHLKIFVEFFVYILHLVTVN